MKSGDFIDKLTINLRNDNTEALAGIFRVYYKALCYFSRRITGDTGQVEDVEDLVIDTFRKLWNSRRDFETPHDIKTFLYDTTRNNCLEFLREKQAQFPPDEGVDAKLPKQGETESPVKTSDIEIIRSEVLRERSGRLQISTTNIRKQHSKTVKKSGNVFQLTIYPQWIRLPLNPK